MTGECSIRDKSAPSLYIDLLDWCQGWWGGESWTPGPEQEGRRYGAQATATLLASGCTDVRLLVGLGRQRLLGYRSTKTHHLYYLFRLIVVYQFVLYIVNNHTCIELCNSSEESSNYHNGSWVGCIMSV